MSGSSKVYSISYLNLGLGFFECLDDIDSPSSVYLIHLILSSGLKVFVIDLSKLLLFLSSISFFFSIWYSILLELLWRNEFDCLLVFWFDWEIISSTKLRWDLNFSSFFSWWLGFLGLRVISYEALRKFAFEDLCWLLDSKKLDWSFM